MTMPTCFSCSKLLYRETRENGMITGFELVCKEDGSVRGGGRSREFGIDTPHRKSDTCYEARPQTEPYWKPIEF